MQIRTLVLVVLLAALALFVALNWSALAAPTDLSLLFTTVQAPVGLIMLGFTVAIVVAFLVFIVYMQTSVVLEARRQARELQSQRELADRAEASRFTELRTYLAGELASLRTSGGGTGGDYGARLDRMEQTLREEIQNAGNTLAAYIGELEERLDERGSTPPLTPDRPRV
jgi:uncharacterized integral membrane protein